MIGRVTRGNGRSNPNLNGSRAINILTGCPAQCKQFRPDHLNYNLLLQAFRLRGVLVLYIY